MTSTEAKDADAAWRPFALVYATFVCSRNWHEVLADFHTRRLAVYVDLLDLDLPDPSDSDPSNRVSGPLGLFARGFHGPATMFGDSVSPFDGVLSTRAPLITVVRTWDPQFRRLDAARKGLLLGAMADTALHLWGAPRRPIVDADLAPYGVDAASEPNENLYT